ncbi:MAG: rhodanese-like domain-containing protein [Ignavibacteria bacterium]|nr:rhodanese-like domain-containing protein [Ignavibacteria bacterium]
MKKIKVLLVLLFLYTLTANSQEKSPFVSFDDYETLMAEVKEHRKSRLLELADYLEMAKQEDVIILDARSEAMYKSKHIKGAVNLNFSDFTQETLAQLISNFETKILIYCNNNFQDDSQNFPTKVSMPKIEEKKGGGDKGITLALNIPTYLNLYGYGYRNVYELNEILSVDDPRMEFEGTSVQK